jgi:hypothetical protein
LHQQPIGASASVKASRQTQQSEENAQNNNQSREAMLFEATGGNTILAAKYGCCSPLTLLFPSRLSSDAPFCCPETLNHLR